MLRLSRIVAVTALPILPIEAAAQARTDVERQQEIGRYCGEITWIVEDNMTRLHNWIIRHTAVYEWLFNRLYRIYQGFALRSGFRNH